MKKSKGGVIITNHSKKRANQRAGLTKNQVATMTKKAIEYGITHSEAKGSLKSWMDSEYLKDKTANNCRLYANNLYIFHNYTLITVLDAPLYYEQELYKYVKNLKIYITYKKNRIKNKKNQLELSKNILASIETEIINKINKKLNKINKSLDIEKYQYYSMNYSSFQIIISYYGKNLPDIQNQIHDYIKNEFGLDTQFKKNKILETDT